MITNFIHIFFVGLMISLSGSLPLGNLNVTAMHIAVANNTRKALIFAIGVTIVEMLYLGVALKSGSYLSSHQQLILYFRIAAILLLLSMAIASFLSAGKRAGKTKNPRLEINKFLLGLLMSLANPMPIPFWFGWIIYLIASSVLKSNLSEDILFITGAGVGTFIALSLFAYTGTRLSSFMKRHKKIVDIATASLFLMLALYQFIDLFHHPKTLTYATIR